MKAVYETPRVSFEAFAANNAVSVCAQAPTSYDCIMHGDRHAEDISDEPKNVVSTAMGLGGCEHNAFFADYTLNIYGSVIGDNNDDASDNVSGLGSGVWGNEHLFSETTRPYWKDFLGWLYISVTGNEESESYSDAGWGKDQYNQLTFYAGKDSNIKHAWLTPLFGIFSNASPSSC